MDLKQFETIAGVEFKDKTLLKQAFTHRSFLNENREQKSGHNERLEFLGDAVLELAVTDFLYKKYPDMDEGELTSLRSALVNADTCAKVAESLAVNDYLLLSKGEAKDSGKARQYILANALEALIGAIYMDQGLDAAAGFIARHVTSLTDAIVGQGTWIDAKSLFQAKSQEFENATPMYKTLKESGPDHDKRFQIGVYIKKDLIGTGEGTSKQDAEQEAARKALDTKGWK